MKAAIAGLVGSRTVLWFGVACVVLVGVLSLTPASVQARTALPGTVEHLIGYAAVTAILVFGTRRAEFPWRIIVAMAVFSGAIELLQFLAPGRHPQIIGAASSIAGSAAGALGGYLLRRGLSDPPALRRK